MTNDLTTKSVKHFSKDDQKLKKYENLRESVNQTFVEGKKHAQEAVEFEKAKTYWSVGNLIDKHVLLNEKRGDYGKKVVSLLANDLGTNQTLLYYALQFARTYKEFPQNKKLSWSHYRALLPVKSEKQREDLEAKVEEWGWSSRQLENVVNRSEKESKVAQESKEKRQSFLEENIYIISELKVVSVKKLGLNLGFDCFYQMDELPKQFYQGDLVKVLSGNSKPKFVKVAKPNQSFRKYLHADISLEGKSDLLLVIHLGFEMRLKKRMRSVDLQFDSAVKLQQAGFIKSLNSIGKTTVRKCVISFRPDLSTADLQLKTIAFHEFV